MTKLKKAIKGFHYTVNDDGTFNVKRGGRYLNKNGTLYINSKPVIKAKPVVETEIKPIGKEDEIQK